MIITNNKKFKFYFKNGTTYIGTYCSLIGSGYSITDIYASITVFGNPYYLRNK